MSNYDYNSIVSKSEADALKEMIFKRVRERAATLDKDVKESYTSSVRNDVMNIAHDSFVSKKNPFSIINEPIQQTNEQKAEDNLSAAEKIKEESNNNEIGFKKRVVPDYFKNSYDKVNQINQKIADNTIKAGMEDAKEEFYNKKTFTGALNFLNSQASISLIKRKGKSFEALA